MENPKCKLCGERHALSEPHVFKPEPKRESVKVKVEKVEKPSNMPTSEQVNREWQTRIHCPTCTCEKKRLHASSADAQRAYRQRRKK